MEALVGLGRIYKDMGLTKLYERLNHEMEEETAHADTLMERMLFLEIQPDMNSADKVRIGSNVKEMLENDLDVEYEVTAALKDAIEVCEAEQDFDSRKILTKLLDDTEMDHAYWLEKQLGLIKKTGLKNYLQSQM